MATITFKGKIQTMHAVDDTPLYDFIQVPTFARRHCDIPAFRTHPRYGVLANSDLFLGVLAKIRRDTFKGRPLRLDDMPDGVTVDRSGFLAVVTLTV